MSDCERARSNRVGYRHLLGSRGRDTPCQVHADAQPECPSYDAAGLHIKRFYGIVAIGRLIWIKGRGSGTQQSIANTAQALSIASPERLALILNGLAAHTFKLLFPPGCESVEPCPAVGDVEPADFFVMEYMGATFTTCEDIVGTIEASNGQTGLVRAVKPYGAAARGTEASLDVFRRFVPGRLATDPAHGPARESDIGADDRPGVFPAHRAVAMAYPHRLNVDLVTHLSAQAPT